MFFSNVFYWMKTNHPIFNMITNNLDSLSDCLVELVHSIIRWCTAKFSTAQQLQKEAHFIFQQQDENEFRQHFVNAVKYSYTLKQLNTLFQKCAIQLLNIFTKIYQAHHIHPSVIKSSSNGINTYKLPSLDYEVTDRHLPQGFVTSKKPNTTILYDYLYCEYTNYLIDGIILTCGHGYHNHYLQCGLKI